jgi:hypothetical protein
MELIPFVSISLSSFRVESTGLRFQDRPPRYYSLLSHPANYHARPTKCLGTTTPLVPSVPSAIPDRADQ